MCQRDNNPTTEKTTAEGHQVKQSTKNYLIVFNKS